MANRSVPPSEQPKRPITMAVGKFVTRKVLNYSETTLTVIGTLTISCGVNFFTGLKIWSSAPEDFYDLLAISLAIPFLYLGYILFRFLEESKLWAKIHETEELTQLAQRKEEFITTRVTLDYTRRSVIHLYRCAALFALPLLLSIYKIVKEWTMIKATFAGVLLAVCSTFGCTRSTNNNSQPATPVSIGYQEIALSRHLFTAKEKGFFEQEGVKVDIKPTSSANRLMEGMVAGQLDGAALVNLQVALTVEGKDPGRIKLVNLQVWKEKSYPDYILVRSSLNIKSLKELEGHPMGLHPGSAVKAFSRTVLQHFSVDVNKITFFELEPAVMQDAVNAGRVDAVYAMDPAATNLVQNGQCRVLIANPMQYIFEAPVPISGTALSAKFLQERPEDAKKIIRALDKAIEYMREPGHEEEIAGYIAKYTPISKETALKLNPSEYWMLTETDRGRVQALANRFQELGIIDKAVDVNSILLPASVSAGGGR